MTERYPTTDEEPGPLDPVVDVLREADVSHQQKAMALVSMAAKEHQYAVQDGEIEDENFLDWSRDTLRALDSVLEDYGRQ